MTTIKCLPLGAGQDVGKSCVIVTINGKRIMFDCGMHMGYDDDRRYPDFSLISKDGNFTDKIACVIITHFHLDHIGALPYFTEICGYNGPIFMTYPTKALAPLMLEDYRKIMVDRKGEQEQFTLQHIHRCMEKVTAIDLKETVQVGSDMIIRPYYAGHVLGAAMFYVKVGGGTVVYTGDYNMTPDRHLGAAQIDRLQPDLLITESTYATTIRDSKHAREREFLNVVHNCISNGGKVLIPVFALGRAQELCILLDDYWERMNLTIPIYFSAGLTMQANVYYKLLISWTSQKVKNTYVTRNTFDFKHVSPFDRSQIEAPGPCVLFATPGMLSGGLSLEVFKKWAVSEQNLTVLPGYCMVGTVGHKLMSGKPSHIEVDKRSQVDVRCQIHQLSFSAHTDARGIMDLVKYVDPCHVVLVHGEKPKMTVLKSRIATELGIPCYDPANHEMVEVPSRFLEVDASRKFIDLSLLHHISTKAFNLTKGGSEESNSLCALASKTVAVEGILARSASNVKLLHPTEASSALGLTSHEIINSCNCTAHFCDENVTQTVDTMETSEEENMKHLDKRPRVELRRTQSLDLERTPVDEESEPESENYTQSDMNVQQPQSLRTSNLKVYLDMNELPSSSSPIEESPGKETKANADLGIIIKCDVITALYSELRSWLGENAMEKKDDSLVAGSLCIQVQEICQEMPAAGTTVDCEKILPVKLTCTWSHSDDTLARRALGVLRTRQFKMPASSSY